MKSNLTDTLIKNITPPPTGYKFYFDAKHPGLCLRVSSTSAKVWVIQKKVKAGRRIHVTLGSYPTVTLKAAREQAYALQAEAEAGIDRIETSRRAEAAKRADAIAARNVNDVLNVYIGTYIEQNLKIGQARNDRIAQLRTHLATLADRPITGVTRLEWQAIIDAKAAEGKTVMANRIRAAFPAFFGWAEKRGQRQKVETTRPSRSRRC